MVMAVIVMLVLDICAHIFIRHCFQSDSYLFKYVVFPEQPLDLWLCVAMILKHTVCVPPMQM